MFTPASCALLFVASLAFAQQSGTLIPELHPPITTKHCTNAGGCIAQSRSVVLDSNWRWAHTVSGYTNCYAGNTWDATVCPEPVMCAQNCALEGADYAATYGITTGSDAVHLNFVTVGPSGTNVGSRVFLMADTNHYQIFKLPNKEISFDVDVSQLPCGVVAGMYFVDMQADGGLSGFTDNNAGARFGTGYCDSQCPRNGNTLGWTPYSETDGKGRYGSCCQEMDIFQGNAYSSIGAAHPCSSSNQYRCQDEIECGERYDYTYAYENPCDKDGCEFNTYRLGNPSFFGPGGTVDTNHKFTVTTQFITDTGEDDGDVVEIRRSYKQNDNDIPVPFSSIVPPPESGMGTFGPYESITDNYCADLKQAFGEVPAFTYVGGLENTITPSGRVLVMSISNDYYNRDATWLDSGAHGPCPAYNADDVELESPSAKVVFSNIRFGEIGSTN
ncbi:cellulase [Pleurotus eryngii]|uniref:Glucanase n=1 Tax=Pleurotus eryngii TaxID=5323 RepID=A0A9P6D9N5_PLEER|nr:cellulase [Pleurotus eryngii]